MSILEQMQEIEKNASSIQDPSILSAMNRKYRELQDQLININVYLPEF